VKKEFDVNILPHGLVAVIERHFPETSHSLPLSFGISKRSEFLSCQLDEAFRHPLLAFGLGPSADSWKRVRKASVELKRAIIALGPDGLRELNWTAPIWWDHDKPLSIEASLLAKLTEEGASRMLAKRQAGVKASKKRDWHAAALAKTARTIWAEEAWLAAPDRYGPAIMNELYILTLPEKEREKAKKQRREYEKHLREFSPMTEKHDGPGPFGRFLEEILCLYGSRISAASSLRSMSVAQKIIDSVSSRSEEN